MWQFDSPEERRLQNGTQNPPAHYKPYLAYYHFKLISLCGKQFYKENKKFHIPIINRFAEIT